MAAVTAALTMVSMVAAGTEQAVAAAPKKGLTAAESAVKQAAHPVLSSTAKAEAAAAAQPLPDLSKTEIVGDRTQLSRTFLDPVSGLRNTQLSTAPLNFKDAAGAWQVIDNKLADDGSGGWKNGANSYALDLPGDLSKPVKVTDALDSSSWLSLQLAPAKTPVSALPVVPGVDSVPIPKIATAAGSIADKTVPNQLVYAKPFAGVDVSYAATGEGVKDTTTLASLAAVNALPGGSITYTLATPSALTVSAAKDGSLSVQNAKGATVFAIPAAVMDDAQGEHSNGVTTTLTADKTLTTGTQNAWTLTLIPDHAWLADPARSWPVVVDPSVIINPPSSINGCTLNSSTPTTSDCAGSEIQTSLNGANARHALLNFTTLLNVVPANAELATAYLNLWSPSATGSPSSLVDFYAVTKPWTTAATWNTYDSTHAWATGGGDFTGPASGTPYEEYPIAASGAYQTTNITRMTQRWLENIKTSPATSFPQYGLLLQKHTTDTTSITHLGSPSSANPPNMYIEWEPRTGVRKGNTAAITYQPGLVHSRVTAW